MRIAFCFSGQIRTFEEGCWDSYKPIFDRYNCDFFVASPPNITFHKYPFKKVLYQQDEVMRDPWYNMNRLPKSPGQNMLRQFYYIELCNNLRLKYEQEKGFKYDFVVRTRCDNILTGNLPKFEHCDPNKIYIPFGHDHPQEYPGKGISDRFAFGNGDIMDKYSNKINILDYYMSMPNSWYFAEVILRWILDTNHIPIVRFDDVVKIKRHNGELV